MPPKSGAWELEKWKAELVIKTKRIPCVPNFSQRSLRRRKGGKGRTGLSLTEAPPWILVERGGGGSGYCYETSLECHKQAIKPIKTNTQDEAFGT